MKIRREGKERCEEEVDSAQEYEEDRACKMQVLDMSCPHAENFTYQARNGCEISWLEAKGWKELEKD
ncbi:MAG: hypothetical protein SVV03_05565 [Candidatus Nanohaloarchaea archaeon]|nr:hypothetical protein [Candidatus Nanohaloarchaea archaeon]